MSKIIQPIAIVIPFRKTQGEVFVWTQVRESADDLSGLLEFPGGKIEKQESPLDCAVREVCEEAGVTVNAVELKKWKCYNFETSSKLILLHTYLYFDNGRKLFPETGLIRLENYLDYAKRIPPKNNEILAELYQYLVN